MTGIRKLYFSVNDCFEKFSIKSSTSYFPLILICISLLSAFPSYDIAFSEEMTENWNSILAQTETPLKPMSYANSSHSANLAFRLTPVLIGKLFGINSILEYLILQLFSLLALFVVINKLSHQLIKDKLNSQLLSLSLSLTFVGNVLCSDYRGFFDVLAFLFIGLMMLIKRPSLILLFALLAYFTDERALIASSLIFTFYLINDHKNTNLSFFKQVLNCSRIATLAISWIIYFMIRVFLGYQYALQTNTSGMLDYLRNEAIQHINIAPFAIWTGLEGFWILVILSVIILLQKKEWLLTCLYVFSLIVVISVALWTYDITRSMAFLMPAIFIGATMSSNFETKSFQRKAYYLTLIFCALPTYYVGGPKAISWLYPLPIQLIRIFTN